MNFADVLMSAASQGSGAGYSAAANAYFAAMTTPPTAARKTLLNNLIVGLQDDGVWTKLDWLNIMAAETAQAARVNAITPAQVGSVVGSPTFTTDRGYLATSGGYINTGWDAVNNGVNFTQNAASFGAYSITASTANNANQIGNNGNSFLGAYVAGNFSARINQSSVNLSVATLGTTVGLWAADRSASNALKTLKNGVEQATGTTASATPSSNDFLIGTSNASTYDVNRTLSAAFMGGHLTDAEHLALYNRLTTYMIAVGAV